MKKYMVIERFKDGCYEQIYARLDQQGRMLPDGLVYIDSWVNKEQGVCYQLMETEDKELFASWTKQWEDLVDFEVVPID